jgi:hypothetical protein
VAVFNGDTTDRIVHLNARTGDEIVLDATESNDPDRDSIAFCWYNYLEARNYAKLLEAKNPELPKTILLIPEDAKGKQIHFILEIHDNNKIASMYDYRRIVINVEN